jgi:hypothetical protein
MGYFGNRDVRPAQARLPGGKDFGEMAGQAARATIVPIPGFSWTWGVSMQYSSRPGVDESRSAACCLAWSVGIIMFRGVKTGIAFCCLVNKESQSFVYLLSS